jgi:excisionase family DNA binding protein
VAAWLGVSAQHVRRMAGSGRIPQPHKFGSLIRWLRVDLDSWLAAGCPPCGEKGGAP